MTTGKRNVGVAMALLFACAAMTFSVSNAARLSAAGGGPTPAPFVREPKHLRLPELSIIPPIFGGGGGAADPELLSCFKSLLGAEDCVTGLLSSLLSGKIDLTKGCCQAIDDMTEHCFSSIFAVPVFGSVFPGLVKSFCAAPASVLPPSA